MDHKEKSRSSAELMEKSQSGMGRKHKSRPSVDNFDKLRKSFDRIGGMMKSVALCSIGCFKHTSSTDWQMNIIHLHIRGKLNLMLFRIIFHLFNNL